MTTAAAVAGGWAGCILVAAGSGSRLGAGIPKALVTLDRVTLLTHAVAGLAAACDVDGRPALNCLVVAAPPDHLEATRELATAAWPADRPLTVLAGGADRVASVRAGLAAMPADVDIVVVHDAARCLTPPSVIGAVVDAVRSGHDAVIPGVPVVDTVKQVDATGEPPWRVLATPGRNSLRSVQTPQAFRRHVLTEAHRSFHALEAAGRTQVTDDAGLVELTGATVVVVPGHHDSLKITTPADMHAARAILAARASQRVGVA